MHIWQRKTLSFILISLMLATWLPGTVLASSTPAISLDQAIQNVKQIFNIPLEYTNFASGFNDNINRQTWSLSWNNPSDSGGSFNAQVDASTGEIISITCWNQDDRDNSQIPSISLAQAQKIGTELLPQLVPSRVASLVLIPDNQIIALTSSGRSDYTLHWQRMVNNVPVSGEGANIQINANNGQVRSYNLNWTNNLDLPAPSGIITPDAARQAFINAGMVQLEYILPNASTYRDQPKSFPLLVYRLDHPSNGRIDAFTGKPLDLDNEQSLYGKGRGMSDVSNKDSIAGAAPIPLTPQEQEEINQTSGLISQEEAAAVVTKWVELSDNLILRTATLTKDGRDNNVRIWNLSWTSNTSASPKQPIDLFGQVDARTGDLLRFNLDLPSDNSSDAAMTLTAAQNLADSFLKKVQPQRYSSLKLDPTSTDVNVNTKLQPVAGQTTWDFNYLRTVNGISFPDNGANIVVDRTSQRIISYNLNWIDRDFPSAQGIIGSDQANDIYLQAAPLTLCYIPVYNDEKTLPEIHLIYQAQNLPEQPDVSMIEAHNGEKLNEQGQPVSKNLGVHIFNDISGNFAEKEIALIGQAGLMSEYGDSFHPDESIKIADLLRAMVNCSVDIYSTRSYTDQDVMNYALRQGWIKEMLAPESTVNRGLLSQLMVRFLGLEYVAKLSDIYQLPYQDGSALGDDLRGYAALTWGLGIMKGDGVNFGAQKLVSRAEAASALVHSLEAKPQM
ncbi:MAG: S-layer homology domain-containing protein [Syntrophomonadaceae bacterium]|nr:S-layer homology domain-containing protein [Syntrophomonadaceae bacterium]